METEAWFEWVQGRRGGHGNSKTRLSFKSTEKGWIGTKCGTHGYKATLRFGSMCTMDPIIHSISFNRHLCSQQTKNSPGQHALTWSRAPAWIRGTAGGTVPPQTQGRAWVSGQSLSNKPPKRHNGTKTPRDPGPLP